MGKFDGAACFRLPALAGRTLQWEVLHGFKDGDTMLSINELHI
jgi:hypothetical protein